MEILTNNHARAYFVKCGLTYQDVTKDHFKKLRAMVNKKLKTSNCFEGSYACYGRIKYTSSDKGGVFYAHFDCQAYYFEKRQCITFEQDGFIGFAGWSDDKNRQPILQSFIEWCNWMKKQIGAKS